MFTGSTSNGVLSRFSTYIKLRHFVNTEQSLHQKWCTDFSVPNIEEKRHRWIHNGEATPLLQSVYFRFVRSLFDLTLRCLLKYALVDVNFFSFTCSHLQYMLPFRLLPVFDVILRNVCLLSNACIHIYTHTHTHAHSKSEKWKKESETKRNERIRRSYPNKNQSSCA